MIKLLAIILAVLILYFPKFIFPVEVIGIWNKYPNNPILPIIPSSWESNKVGSPTILKNDGLYKMWYHGSDSLRVKIGYATSSSGILWQRNGYPVLVGNEYDPKNIQAQNPSVIKLGDKYLLWYAASDITINNLHINLSTSLDGINWSDQRWEVISPEFTWETTQGKGVSFPRVLYLNNEYKMWYGGFGSRDGIITWRIGYAFSSNGINWQKFPEPILQPDTVWENRGGGRGISNASVLYENGVYHMFYHGDRDIGHAVSLDGINWIKNPENPILTPGTGDDFDNFRVMDPFVLKNEEDGKYYMYYTGANKNDIWQIGLAISDSLPDLGLNPTPTPTPTPTIFPTPTVTPTLSPTPSNFPSQFFPIILIPGLGASWNPKALLSCNLEEKGTWELAPYVSVYKRLLKTLTENAGFKLNKDIFLYTYDWRQPLDVQGETFKKFVEKILNAKPYGTKVILIGHSLGGLVIRSYLANYPSEVQRVEKVLTIGTPHMGTVLAYPLWEKGEVWTNDRILKLAIYNLLNFCRFRQPKLTVVNKFPKLSFLTNKELIQLFMPSAKSLLPIFNFLKKEGRVINVNEMKERNEWLPSHLLPLQNILVSTLSGEGIETLRYLEVIEPSLKEKSAGDWIDGKPKNKQFLKEGDGTILNLSSELSDVENRKIRGNHLEIVSSENGIREILNFLGLASVNPAISEVVPELTSQEILSFSFDKETDFEIIDPKSKIYKSNKNLIVIYNPERGVYKLKIFPNKKENLDLFLNLLSEERDNNWQFTIKVKKLSMLEVMLIFSGERNPLVKLLY